MALGWSSMQLATRNKGNPNAVRTQPKEKAERVIKTCSRGAQ